MNPDLEKLFELQKVDAEVSRLAAEVAALPKRVQAIEAQLAASQDGVEKAKAAIKADDAARRKYESDIQSLQDKIGKFRDQSSAVKTNDQYKALLQEISFAEKAIRELEDKILETMELSEKKNGKLKEAEAHLKAETAAVEKEKNEARARTAEDESKLQELRAQREGLRVGVSESLLNHYDRVLKHRGTALVEARAQRCTGCQVMLRPQVFNEIISDIVHTCDSCSRILYYDPSQDEPDEVKARAGNKSGGPVERSWVYLPDRGECGIFAVLSNAKGGCSLRIYDASSGRALEPIQRVKGKTYQQAFREYLDYGRALFMDEIESMDERCKEELPEEVLAELQRQLPNKSEASEGVQ